MRAPSEGGPVLRILTARVTWVQAKLFLYLAAVIKMLRVAEGPPFTVAMLAVKTLLRRWLVSLKVRVGLALSVNG